jgi:6-phosphofructokinase 1
MINKKINRIGILTSGGDAPGMNACIRAVVRTAIHYNLEIFGIKRGYQGLIENDIYKLSSNSVSNIIQRGGTILKSARSLEFKTSEGRLKAHENLTNNNIDALITVGGDGTLTGALNFGSEYSFPIIGIPGTIDNDLSGTDKTIGFDTATNTALEAIDNIRDTANSHNRLFFVEVMGRNTGFIAIQAGIGGGAEAILIPEKETSIEELAAILDQGVKSNKSSSIIIVAEGQESGRTIEIAKQIKERFSYYDTRFSILGHIQRGGTPNSADRLLGSILGAKAVEGLIEGKESCMVGIIKNEIVYTPFEEILNTKKSINSEYLRIAKLLSSN